MYASDPPKENSTSASNFPEAFAHQPAFHSVGNDLGSDSQWINEGPVLFNAPLVDDSRLQLDIEDLW